MRSNFWSFALVGLFVSGCVIPQGTYTIRTRDVRSSIGCAVGGEFTVASLTLNNNTLDTVTLTIPPVTGLIVSGLDAIPPRTEGAVFFSVRCPVGRSFTVTVLATAEPDTVEARGRRTAVVLRGAKRTWSFTDNLRRVRHDAWLIERQGSSLTFR